jgi:hypothetical protein
MDIATKKKEIYTLGQKPSGHKPSDKPSSPSIMKLSLDILLLEVISVIHFPV